MLKAIGRFLSGKRKLNLHRRIAYSGPSEWLGTQYGGHALAVQAIGPKPLVYSFGIGEDISFDLQMIERFGATVHAFDPTPKSINWLKTQNLPDSFHYQALGIGGHDGTASFVPPKNPEHVSHRLVSSQQANSAQAIEFKVQTLQTVMQALGHTHLDVLKLDVEGSEYASLENILASGLRVPQLLVEFHHQFPEISPKKTLDALDALESFGYRIFAVSESEHEISLILP